MSDLEVNEAKPTITSGLSQSCILNQNCDQEVKSYSEWIFRRAKVCIVSN